MPGFMLGRTHVPHRKNTAGQPAQRMPAPEVVTILTSQHIGAPAVAAVKVGDTVVVTDGLFEGYKGTVQSISDDLKKVTVLIKRGSRDMPVELDASSVKLV